MKPPTRIPLTDRLWSAWRKSGARGFTRAWGWHLARGGAPELLHRSNYGTVFALDPLGYIDGIVITEGFYESEVLEALRPHLAQDGVLWDIGSNFGLHAVTTKRLQPSSVVCAFEPAPPMLARLARNAALNDVEVTTLPLALSDRDGTATLHLAGEGNPGMSTLSPWNEFRYASTLEIRTARGDTLAAQAIAPPPSVIKLDVEGHEPAVLRGLSATLRSPTCRAVVFEDDKRSETETKLLLRAAGFEIAPLTRHQQSDHALANFVARKGRA